MLLIVFRHPPRPAPIRVVNEVPRLLGTAAGVAHQAGPLLIVRGFVCKQGDRFEAQARAFTRNDITALALWRGMKPSWNAWN